MMGKFENIIIVSDIDGTFLGKGSRMVPENVQAIEYFKSEGGLFTIATGREIMNIPTVVPNVATLCNAPVIAVNGACIWDASADRILHEEFLPEPDVSRIADAARTLCPDIPMRISVRGEFRTEQMREITKKTFHNMLPWFHIMPYEDMEHGSWYKLGWDGTPEELSRVRAALTPMMGEQCLLQLGHQTILEVQSRRATKGAMLSMLKRLTGHENAVLWAIGDYENDHLMLTMADRCAMPEDGMDKLRAIPGIVELCDHNRGAIADLIRHIEKEMTEAE